MFLPTFSQKVMIQIILLKIILNNSHPHPSERLHALAHCSPQEPHEHRLPASRGQSPSQPGNTRQCVCFVSCVFFADAVFIFY